MGIWGYPGANFGKRSERPARSERYLADKAALMRAKKYYTPEEFAQLLADLQDERISLRIYEEGIVIDRKVSR